MASLLNRTAIVVGTSPNIGYGICAALAEQGAAIACWDGDPFNAERCASSLREQGATAHGFLVEASSEGDVAAAFGDTIERFGRVDILVNGAARMSGIPMHDMSFLEWANQTRTVLDSAFLATKAVSRWMVDNRARGVIVNILSTAAHQGEPGNIAYATAKAGLSNFTRAAATELGPHGIRVVSLTPTATDPRSGNARAREWGRPRDESTVATKLATLAPMLPLRALPDPSDYGHAVAWVCSDEARYITGSEIRVDAGALGQYWRTVGWPDRNELSHPTTR